MKKYIKFAIFAILVAITAYIGVLVEEATAVEAAPVAPEEIVYEEVIEEVQEPVEAIVEPLVMYYDVPLDRDLQDHIFAECEKYNVDPDLIVAMIQKESTFDASAIGDSGNSFGLMQIQPRWHQERMRVLGLDDLLDPYQNVTCGITIISELIEKDRGLEWALMTYNGGSKYANDKVAAGVVTEYVYKVYEYRDALTMVA